MTATTPAPADLDAVQATYDHYAARHDHPGAFACCTAHAVADRVPDIVAEVRRLRAELEKDRRALNLVDAIRDGIDASNLPPCPVLHDNRATCLRCIAIDLYVALNPAP